MIGEARGGGRGEGFKQEGKREKRRIMNEAADWIMMRECGVFLHCIVGWCL